MNYQELLNLIDKLDKSTVAYVEFNQGENRVVLAKENPNQVTREDVVNKPKSTTSNVVTPSNQPMNQEISSPVESVDVGEAVLSPLVGIAYLQPKPDAETFVKIGDTVKKGQVLCIVEAMKLMNDIVSPFDGIVSEILIENETVVEFNQPLFKINTK
ncbi:MULTISPECIES: acetyl-CoA carboxylase biotin carboxyl carrier protein [unclassified Facklamia]|uniref:acetyl-CoA carboxylase biotin carboxyl carrier protein n=1 Tax=Aerococcaceae TaxID=186827 RepID=UPI0013BE60A9|nr:MULTISPECIES: acetyl-CoA carboxylase biotin carboxyl carrier protein [unclassified Facklamia]NEW64327.1 acetyl-CoA carboxylase biotin carboxyl carrier protein [Facklamia sp. 252]NEW67836.1 acetyl-CoA carboxylase biotin carboxyl carrier protein [Facklamia sp. 253]QQD64791.1 acetyl-CoA carboxylase biotin carboxyl carrier protein [Aerococcaceae bacterium zg-252]